MILQTNKQIYKSGSNSAEHTQFTLPDRSYTVGTAIQVSNELTYALNSIILDLLLNIAEERFQKCEIQQSVFNI